MKPLADYSHIRGFNYTASYAKDDRDSGSITATTWWTGKWDTRSA